MFTGIVREVGHVRGISHSGDTKIRIGCARPIESIEIGASIACAGVCLTVVATGQDEQGGWFAVDASSETRAKTTLGGWEVGTAINLEPALRLGDELGGHIVTGHVDAVGEVTRAEEAGDSWQVDVRAPKELAPFIAPKGSITVQGVSLTVNEVRDEEDGSCTFMLNIIPHTGEVTTLGALKAGDQVNLEIDVLARYLKRMQALAGA